VHHPENNTDLREAKDPAFGSTAQIRERGSPLGLTHSARDAATENITFRTRITPGIPITRTQHRLQSKKLVCALGKLVDLRDQGFDRGLFEQCHRERLVSWVHSRSTRDIENSLDAAPVDIPRTWVDVFVKSQRVKKIGVATAHAKAGLAVTNVAQSQLFIDDVWSLYVQRQLERRVLPTTYLHCGKNFDQQRDWAARFWNPSLVCVASDYTGWDTGVNEAFSHAYREVFIRFGVPLDVANAFVETRHSRTSFLGHLPAMQASGDRNTWLCNTLGNMMLTSLSFNFPTGTPACFSGDDMILNGDFTFSDPHISTFKPKLERGDRLEFCGFTYGGQQLYLAPTVLLHRLTMALEDGRRDLAFWDSALLAIRQAQTGDPEPDPVLGSCLALSMAARRAFNLPPPPRDMRPFTLARRPGETMRAALSRIHAPVLALPVHRNRTAPTLKHRSYVSPPVGPRLPSFPLPLRASPLY
jgi:hypothetical protein